MSIKKNNYEIKRISDENHIFLINSNKKETKEKKTCFIF